MADQNRNPQSNENPSSAQQSSRRDDQQSTQQTQGNPDNRDWSREDESTSGSQRERSNREPASTAHDSGDLDRRSAGGEETLDALESETDVESEDSDLDDEDISNR